MTATRHDAAAVGRRAAGRGAAGTTCRRALLAAALASGLAGCNPFRGEQPPPPCPRAAILRGADTVTVYRPGADRVRENVRYFGALTDLASACRYGADGVTVDLRVAVAAEKGAAYEGPARLTYFVAVVGPDRTVLAREALTTEVAIPAGATRAGVAEELTQTIPGVTPGDAPVYRVFLGFQLSEEDARRRLGGR